MPQDTVLLGLGIDVTSLQGWTVSAKTTLELRDQYTGIGGTLQIRKDL